MLLYSAATTPSLRGLVCNSSVLLGSHHQDTMLGCMLQVYSIECTMKRWEAHNHQGGLTACVFRTAYTLALFQLQVELTADEYNWSHPQKPNNTQSQTCNLLKRRVHTEHSHQKARYMHYPHALGPKHPVMYTQPSPNNALCELYSLYH